MIKVIKVREVRIAIEVKRSDAGDVSPVAMFLSIVMFAHVSNCSVDCG